MTTQARLPYLVALILCTLGVMSTYQFHKELMNRVSQQQQIIATRQTWNNELTAMQPLVDGWKATLPHSSALIDQYRIIQRIDAPSLELTLNETGLAVGEPAHLAHNGKAIGLLRYPVGNQGPSLSFTAPDFTTAWEALTKLQARPDIRYTRAKLENHNGKPILTLENFAVIARVEP